MYFNKRIKKKHIKPMSQRHVDEFYEAYEDKFDTDSVFDLEDEFIKIHHILILIYNIIR